jgi:hypothetical protein
VNGGVNFVGSKFNFEALCGINLLNLRDNEVRKISKGKKSKHYVKKWKEVFRMVVGEDMNLEKIMDFHGLSLIGCFHSCQKVEETLISWMKIQWFLLLGYLPRFHLVLKVWLCFIMRLNVDVDKIMGKKWYWGSSILSMEIWRTFLYPRVKPVSKLLISVKFLWDPLK